MKINDIKEHGSFSADLLAFLEQHGDELFTSKELHEKMKLGERGISELSVQAALISLLRRDLIGKYRASHKGPTWWATKKTIKKLEEVIKNERAEFRKKWGLLND